MFVSAVYSHQLFRADKYLYLGADGTFILPQSNNVTSSTDLDNSKYYFVNQSSYIVIPWDIYTEL